MSIVIPQDYRKRFFALSPSEQALSPPPCDVEFSPHSSGTLPALPNPTLSHDPSPHSAQGERVDLFSPTDISMTPILPIPDRVQPPSLSKAAASAPLLSLSRSRESSQHSPATSIDALKIKPSSPLMGFPSQPFKKECIRIIATFLRPDAVKELPLTDTVRFRAIKALAHTTHPDVVRW